MSNQLSEQACCDEEETARVCWLNELALYVFSQDDIITKVEIGDVESLVECDTKLSIIECQTCGT